MDCHSTAMYRGIVKTATNQESSCRDSLYLGLSHRDWAHREWAPAKYRQAERTALFLEGPEGTRRWRAGVGTPYILGNYCGFRRTYSSPRLKPPVRIGRPRTALPG